MQTRSSAETDAAPVHPSLVVLSAALIPVLVTAFVVLYLLPPGVGGEYFAWPVRPRMSAMMLGATYLGGAYFFAVVIASRQWRHVRLGFLPISAFAATLGLATLLHWELFVHDRVGFWVWAGLYFAVPFLLPVLWHLNRRHAAGEPAWEGDYLPRTSRRAFGALGVVLTVAGVLLFVVPDRMLATWPWPLTPLTARVMAAIYLLPGLVGMRLAVDGRWSAARHLLGSLAFTILLMFVAVYAARTDFDWGHPASWLFVAGLGAILALIAYTYRERPEPA